MSVHYHVRGGRNGRSAWDRQIFMVKHDAVVWLKRYVDTFHREPGNRSNKSVVCSGWINSRSVHFRFGYGGEYGEIVACGDHTCREHSQCDSLQQSVAIGSKY